MAHDQKNMALGASESQVKIRDEQDRTVLELPSNCGAVLFEPTGHIRLFLPKMEEDQDVPPHILLIGALGTRLTSREWQKELIETFVQDAAGLDGQAQE